MYNKIDKLDQTIYFYTINIAGFLKSLKKIGESNIHTATISKFAKDLYSTFNNFYEKSDKSKDFDEIKTKLITLIEEIQKIVIEKIPEEKLEIVHEKADIYLTGDKILTMLKNFDNEN
jgi:hypothetical protein